MADHGTVMTSALRTPTVLTREAQSSTRHISKGREAVMELKLE